MTASAMVTDVAISTEAFLDRPAALSAFCRLGSRISLGRDLIAADKAGEPADVGPDGEDSGGDLVDFEFRLNHPVAMLPADELFADGKLVPLQLAATKPASMHSAAEVRSPERRKSMRVAQVSGSDPYVFSPRAPSCTSRWRELLGLKRAAITKMDPENVSPAPAAAKSSNPNPDARSLKHFFHRNHKSSPLEPSLSLPLLRDSDSESVSISARLSLSSSSSSGLDHEDLPRFSLDSDKPNHHIPPMVRLVRPPPAASELGRSRIRRTGSSEMATPPPLTVPVDSPRMNPSGKVVFHGLERSSSSPGSFTGGPRPRARGMERSYSANVVRVAPVLNVPVCSLRGSAKASPVFGFGQLFSPQKKDKAGPGGSAAARIGGTGKTKSEKASNSWN
ncbi:hypothetical protein OPV22_015039 [Ensete ventricosum]|uniref:DUF3741 domain-containing protein n=1 Tax=Ensete ventricosum TaxID=4639 RepID=A0AAV8RB04_ENSVE|nr:hypothetical protein OPV22_015039 [Ensete ventricosum]RWW46123.1 hypothetical protein BHE74_00047979 [Ensete ventricosum]